MYWAMDAASNLIRAGWVLTKASYNDQVIELETPSDLETHPTAFPSSGVKFDFCCADVPEELKLWNEWLEGEARWKSHLKIQLAQGGKSMELVTQSA